MFQVRKQTTGTKLNPIVIWMLLSVGLQNLPAFRCFLAYQMKKGLSTSEAQEQGLNKMNGKKFRYGFMKLKLTHAHLLT
jgi:hypothetical protein